MRIGSPLSPSATRVMLLGSGELGKPTERAFTRLMATSPARLLAGEPLESGGG